MIIHTNIQKIDKNLWQHLIAQSSTATWFQTPQAYDFFAQQPYLFKPFVVAIPKRAYCVGYITQEQNPIKQFLTRRAIIIGGPALADDCTEEEVKSLLHEVVRLIHNDAIYIETRNFHDYSPWRTAFEQCGFDYQPHLNFKVDTLNWNQVEENIGKHRKKYIRLSMRDGATIVTDGTLEQVKEYYVLLTELYKEKVRMPLQPWSFFEKLYKLPSCKYILVEYEGKIMGGSICMLLFGHGVYEWYACGKDGVHKNIHPSSVTKYAGMRYAYENGYPLFDMMGAGRPDEPYGVRDFKAEFGGRLVEYGRYIYQCKPLLYRVGKMGVKILKKV